MFTRCRYELTLSLGSTSLTSRRRQRIRKGIFDKAWLSLSHALESSGDLAARLLAEEQTTLLHVLEK